MRTKNVDPSTLTLHAADKIPFTIILSILGLVASRETESELCVRKNSLDTRFYMTLVDKWGEFFIFPFNQRGVVSVMPNTMLKSKYALATDWI